MKKAIMAIVAASACAVALAAPVKGEKAQIHFLETTDVHGSFFPIDFISGQPTDGSMARVSQYVKTLRASAPDAVVLLDNGDILQGRPLSYYYNYVATDKENVASSVINYMGYDAESFGNHDVEATHAVFDKWVSEVKCPSLGANILDASTSLPYAVPYTIVNRKGVKVAILGMLTPAIPNWLAENVWSGMRFAPMVESARYWVNYLRRNEKPDVIVGLFHSGYEGGIQNDKYSENATAQVAREVPGFDVIFCGHDHRVHNTMDKVNGGGEVLVLNPANNAMAVAHATLDLEFDGARWTVTNRKGAIVDMAKTPIDTDYMAHFAPQIEEVKQWVSRPIGRITSTISSADCFFGNSAFGDMILDLTLRAQKADIAFSAPLQANATLRKGVITVGNMFDLYRFENDLYILNLTGAEVRKHLEMSYGLWVNTMKSPADHIMRMTDTGKGLWFEKPTYNFDSAAGIDYEVDVTKPEGERVKILRMSNGEPFDESKVYRVAMNSYRANGGGELLTRGAGIPKDQLESRIVYRSTTQMRNELMKVIEQAGTIDPKPAHNWKFVPEKWTKPALARDRKILFPKKNK